MTEGKERTNTKPLATTRKPKIKWAGQGTKTKKK